jgi:hypothetical protein
MPLLFGGLDITVIPKLGPRGDLRSVRSGESIGKLDSSPPSTSVDVSPVALVKLASPATDVGNLSPAVAAQGATGYQTSTLLPNFAEPQYKRCYRKPQRL